MNDTNGRMRVSDAERDEVAGQLREHHAVGRLDPGELDERLSATFAARTRDDLAAVTVDLPSPASWPLAEQPPVPATRGGSGLLPGHRGRLVLGIVAVWLLFGAIGQALGTAMGMDGPGPFPAVIFLVVLFAVVRRRRARQRQRQQELTAPVTGSAAAGSARTR